MRRMLGRCIAVYSDFVVNGVHGAGVRSPPPDRVPPLACAGITEARMSEQRDELAEPVSVRFPAKVRARLQELASADDRRLSQVVRRIVVRALETNDEGIAA
jgi:hypothetical protein